MNSIKQSLRDRLFIYSAALISALGMSACALPAIAQDAGFMPVGQKILAPTAFLEMCSRSPIDCQHSGQINLVRTQILARQSLMEKYDLVFGGARKTSEQSAQIAAAADRPEVATAQVADRNLYITWPMLSEARMPMRLSPIVTPVSYVLPADTDRDPTPGALNDSAWGGRRLTWAGRSETALTPPVLTSATVVTPAIAPVEPAVIEAVASDDDTPMLYMTDAEMAAVKARRAEIAAAKAAIVTVRVKPAYAAALPYQARAPVARRQIFTAANANQITMTSDPSDYLRIDLDAATLQTVKRTNAYVNRVLISQTDQSKRHVNDYWEAPSLEGRPTGDCEDFALAKRRLLIQNGIPAAALSLAVVKTRQGEDHAVLIVSTQQGDLVLDSLAYDVKPWQKAGYTWISRQGPDDNLTWVSLAPANKDGAGWKARTVRVAYAD